MKATLLLFLLIPALYAITLLKLVPLWSYKIGDEEIASLAFSDNGNLGVASWDGCAYVFSPDGKLLNKVCTESVCCGCMNDVSYCCGKFAFINFDDYAYITDENGTLIKKIYVGSNYDMAITLIQDGFMACSYECGFFDLNGNKLWSVDVGNVQEGPSYYQGYWYAIDWERDILVIIKDGSIVNEIYYGTLEVPSDSAVCGNYLAVSTCCKLHLYDIGSNPKIPNVIWTREGLSVTEEVTFSPDCKYIAVTSVLDKELIIYDIKGNIVAMKAFDSEPWSVAWWKDRIAVGLYDGSIYVFKVEEVQMALSGTQSQGPTTSTTSETATNEMRTSISFPGPALLALLVSLLRRR